MSTEPTRIIDAAAMRLAGIDAHYVCDDIAGIPGQWGRFVPYTVSIPERIGHVTYGVSHNQTETVFDYMAAVEVGDSTVLPEGLTELRLPAQRYAVFNFDDHISQFQKAIWAIWSEWLPSSGHSPVDSPVLLERYGEGFDPVAGRGDIEIWFAIKS